MRKAIAVVAAVTVMAWVIDGPLTAIVFAGLVTGGSLGRFR